MSLQVNDMGSLIIRGTIDKPRSGLLFQVDALVLVRKTAKGQKVNSCYLDGLVIKSDDDKRIKLTVTAFEAAHINKVHYGK